MTTIETGAKVIHRRWPLDPAGIVTEYPAIDPDGDAWPNLAVVRWPADGSAPEFEENEEVSDLVRL